MIHELRNTERAVVCHAFQFGERILYGVIDCGRFSASVGRSFAFRVREYISPTFKVLITSFLICLWVNVSYSMIKHSEQELTVPRFYQSVNHDFKAMPYATVML